VSHEFPADFVDTSPEELATIINVNVTATLRVTNLIAPSMVSRFVSSSLDVVSWLGCPDGTLLTHRFRPHHHQ